MTTTSYADRARRFLAEQSAATDGGGDESDQSDESPPDRDLSSLTSLSSPPEAGTPSPTGSGVEGEESDQSGETPTEAVWWDDRVPVGSAPILCLPPPPCIAPRACARLGPCARHVAGASCLRQP